MPWCDACSQFWNPNSVPPDGRCPKCSSALATKEPDGDTGGRSAEAGEDYEYPKAPWHFKVLVVLTVIYLGWRFVQLVGSVL